MLYIVAVGLFLLTVGFIAVSISSIASKLSSLLDQDGGLSQGVERFNLNGIKELGLVPQGTELVPVTEESQPKQ